MREGELADVTKKRDEAREMWTLYRNQRHEMFMNGYKAISLKVGSSLSLSLTHTHIHTLTHTHTHTILRS